MWLRARERKLRWDEEWIILLHEMECHQRGLRKHASNWDVRAAANKDLPGHHAYAKRQEAMWLRMAEHAGGVFKHVVDTYRP